MEQLERLIAAHIAAQEKRVSTALMLTQIGATFSLELNYLRARGEGSTARAKGLKADAAEHRRSRDVALANLSKDEEAALSAIEDFRPNDPAAVDAKASYLASLLPEFISNDQ